MCKWKVLSLMKKGAIKCSIFFSVRRRTETCEIELNSAQKLSHTKRLFTDISSLYISLILLKKFASSKG